MTTLHGRLLRRVLALAVLTGLGLLATAVAASADVIPGGAVGGAACGALFSQALCSGAQMASNFAPQGLGDAASHVFGSFMPSDPVSDWASSAGKSSARALAQVQTSMIKMGQPHFLDSWWLTRYGVTFGIGLVIMAGTVTFLAARLSAHGPEGYRMLRQAGISASLYVPAMALLPAAADIVVQTIYALTDWFAQQTTADSGTAIAAYVKVLNDMGDPNKFALGALGLLLFAGIAFVAAVLAMIENATATFGAQLLMLMVPAIAAIAVYPPARKPLSRIGGIIGGLLLTPVLLFLSYWTVWGAAASLMTGHAPDPPMTMLFVAVGSLVAISAPAVLGMLAPSMVSSLGGHHGASQRLRQHATNARRGVTAGARKIDQARRGGSAAGGAAKSGATAATTAAGGAATAGVATGAKAAQKAGQTAQSSAHRTGQGRGETTQSTTPSSTSSPAHSSAPQSSTGAQSSSSGGQGLGAAPPTSTGASPHGPGSSGPSASSSSSSAGSGSSPHGGTQRISGVLPLDPEPPAPGSSSGSTGSGRSAQEGHT
jgi:hypothetical protein